MNEKQIDIETNEEFTPVLADTPPPTTQAEINIDRWRFKQWRERERDAE
jgi:hypothetical protein